MYAYEWDSSTGGYILTPMPLAFSKEPRPVYYKELDILGFDKYWDYDKNDSFPYMWAEANNYYYRGRLVAKTKGGSLYTPPELVLIEDPEPEGYPLRFVDIPAMVDKNRQLMEQLVQETIKKIYNTFIEYQDKVDVFYVAFSGGKDSVVALDLVQRALPHNCFKVLFGDTGMEFPDTYETVEKIKQICAEEKIEFLQAKSKLKPENTWQIFGPPAVTIRWCCSVHKTTPQIMQLREVLQKPDFTGMAFTGVRGDESLSRSEYDAISYGGKHSGQYSCHPILEWNTAELFLYIYENGLTFNNAYKKGNTRAGCLVCPMSQGKHDYMKYKNYPDDTDLFINKIITTSGKNFSKENYDRFVEQGYWRTRKSGRELSFGHDKHVFEIVKGQNVITVQKKNEYWKEWAKTIGQVTSLGDGEFSIAYEGKPKKALMEARTLIAECIGAQPDEIYFTSGGTESDNWAIKGIAEKGKKHHTIATQIEHHAILNACRRLEHFGFQVDYLPVDKQGVVSCEDLVKFIKGNTELISVMMVNNEIGTIEPIKELATVAHDNGILFHTDAVQAVGHIPIDVSDLCVDMLSASAHKFNGPKGIGFLYIKRGTKISSFADGGAQEFHKRAGTENIASIVGMSIALKKSCDEMEKVNKKLLALDEAFNDVLLKSKIDFIRNGSNNHVPGNINLSIRRTSGEMLLHRLDLMGICISTGSACDSVNTEVSHVIKAIGVPSEYSEGTIRISFGRDNTEEDAIMIAKALVKVIKG